MSEDVCDKRLDLDIVKWVATGPADSYGRSINAVALAREVLNLRAETDGMREMLADSIVVHHDDRAEIDWLRRISELLAAALLSRGVEAKDCDALDEWLRR
jgi:hypothetical protein